MKSALSKVVMILSAATLLAWMLPVKNALANPSAASEPIAAAVSGEHCEYRGDIDGNIHIGMMLVFSKDSNTVSGSYFYVKHLTDIRIEGEIVDRSIVIREFDANNRQTGIFRGEFPTRDPRKNYGDSKLTRDVIVGAWSKPDGSASRPFYLNLSHIFYSQAQNRYCNAGFDDANVADAFMQKFRSAVLAGEKASVAGMISYPIKVRVEGEKDRVSIRNQKELLKRYDAIFGKKFMERIDAAVPFHMFSRSEGVMLGNGEVWIAPLEEKTGTAARFVPRVIAINN